MAVYENQAMVVDGVSPVVSTANATPGQRVGDHRQRCEGDPRSLSMISLNDLPDAHRRLVMESLREIVQRTCSETVQQLVEKRKNIADVINIVKQRTNLTFFDLRASAGGSEQLACINQNASQYTNGNCTDNHIPVASAGSSANNTFAHVNGHNNSGQPLSAAPSSVPFTSPFKIAPPVISVTSNFPTISSLDNFSALKPARLDNATTSTELTATILPNDPNQNYINVADGLFPPTSSTSHPLTPATADTPADVVESRSSLHIRRKRPKKRLGFNVDISPAPEEATDELANTTSNSVDSQSQPKSDQSQPKSDRQDSETASKEVKTSAEDSSLSMSCDLLPQPRRPCRINSAVRFRSAPTNRVRRNGSSIQRNHDWLHQRWKSVPGTAVTHYLTLSARDSVDYPDDTLPNESMLISISDYDDRESVNEERIGSEVDREVYDEVFVDGDSTQQLSTKPAHKRATNSSSVPRRRAKRRNSHVTASSKRLARRDSRINFSDAVELFENEPEQACADASKKEKTAFPQTTDRHISGNGGTNAATSALLPSRVSSNRRRRRPAAPRLPNGLQRAAADERILPSTNDFRQAPAARPSTTAGVVIPEMSVPAQFPINSTVLMALEHKHIDKWSEEEVAQYIAAFEFHVSPDIPRQFIRDGIDGQALLLLNMEMLTSTMHIPFGHALKINFAIEELRKNNGMIDVTKLRIPVQ